MKILDKLTSIIAPEDGSMDDENEELTEEEKESLSRYEKAKNPGVDTKNPAKMVLFEPRSFEESEEIGYHLKARRACVVNLHRVTKDSAQRIIDFLTGSVFALDGTISRIGDNVILCTPRDMGVAGDITLQTE